MPIGDLFGLLRKRQTTPDKYLASSVNVVGAGQHGAKRPDFSQQRGISSFRSWVYAAASINANAVAATPLRLYSMKDEIGRVSSRSVSRHRKAYLFGDAPGDQRPSTSVLRKSAMYGDDMREIVDHPILDLLNSANPYLNGFDLSVLRVLYGELTGNAYLHPVIDDASGVPIELWPLAPQHVEVIPDEDTFIRGYVYGVDSQRKQIFEPDEVIHFRRPNPGNLFYGMGKVEAAFGVIASNEALHQMDLSTFQNSARPDYAVVVKGTPTGDQFDRFQQQVEQRLRGTRKDGNFITVTGDVQFTPLNFPPKDIAGREEIVEEIAAVFGVPVSMLKANDPNLASATSGFAQWREGTVLPLVRMDEQELNQRLLGMFGLGEEYCLAYDNPVPSDLAFELQERQTAVAGGWRTPNEARLEEGREAGRERVRGSVARERSTARRRRKR
jgi:HK97 family phage portal protein